MAVFHLPNHSTTASDSSAREVEVTSSSWCVLLFLFMLGLTSGSSTSISTISFPDSLHPFPREHTDRLADLICRQAAGPTAQRPSETPGQGWNQDGEYAAASLDRLSKLVGDSRTLWPVWGTCLVDRDARPPERSVAFTTADNTLTSIYSLPPHFRAAFLPRAQRASARPLLFHIEQLQGLRMLVCYPLGYVYYLASHSILPLSPTKPSSRRCEAARCGRRTSSCNLGILKED